ncbi:hypothetical protein DOTSEDRAFT_80915 [Dothistroma septosporum NZE10]|uniref:Uncharacterized protein n=1 Tax=Dothistroma septosporum (strain NZE10 / CBS 128990) TaxID=675120 RepID=M2YPN3_DOTSN|nr:hypothetical protein DOTSEDRAFT_80915 [Dothistroma septosporum NZE10]
MNDKASKPEKKGIARAIKKSTRATMTATTSQRASRRVSKAKFPGSIEEEPKSDKGPEEEDDGDERHSKDMPDDAPMQKIKSKPGKDSRPSAKMADIPEAEDDYKDEPPTKTKANATNKSSMKAPQVSEDEEIRYFDRIYVAAHKDTENFHHRGAGRWASGLPRPEAKFKTACVGPGAEAWKAAHKDNGK